MHEEIEMIDTSGVRLCNTISLLIPAYSYHINCAWTQQIPLPAIEEFTCRLLIALREITPGEVQQYFGLSKRECQVLIETLEKNKLVTHNNDGMLVPTSILIDRTKDNPEATPSLTKYEIKTETVVFEALTVSIMPSNSYNRSRHGLPQVPIPEENHSPSPQLITELFGSQFRAFLDYSRRSQAETRKTRLYKVDGCSTGKFVQIPIDLEIWVRPTKEGDVEIIKKVAEKTSGGRQRPLSMEVEAKISDYLNGLPRPKKGMSILGFTKIFNDYVLDRYIDDRGLDLNRWLLDHANRKTGYGQQSTRSMVGPIFHANNKRYIDGMIEELAVDWKAGQVHRAFWLSSSAPLWGANGSLMSEFCNEMSRRLSEDRQSRGHVTAILPYEDTKDLGALKSNFHARIPCGIAYKGADLQTPVEIFLIPGQLAVVQYHVQPDNASAITVPIGYVTVEHERIQAIEGYLDNLVKSRGKPEFAWGDGASKIDDLMGDCRTHFCEASRKPVLSLARPAAADGSDAQVE
ncbi:hypothetical protein [Pseudomonas amygdali]|uniref:Uncharacterized protein n=2 Tax=Pseudomonas amygdali pv. lachrymans TaxID=53707 RepID=A0ABR5KS35_PSEAV|nr:hypothetical protein [Pseudomonas amygdali]AXH60220.1 hypothetical protein PLA107_034095 [Pseudomonas amygdali pv. lachrymans str. M301315]KPC17617.1 Uncharacterized protein AC499_0819 [Pseudomonas amygdali pv. lachrymans]RMT06146.1 hypothetical protein ALP54_04054 [Pseudomonas amygdali pv. lachrymans]